MSSSHDHPALARMLSSNEQWARDVEIAEPGFFENVAKGQFPQILWIGCSDSRVPESVLLAARPGDLFVTRNIANQYHLDDDCANAVLSFAVNNVGVEHVVIVGHTNCGGAAACHRIASGEMAPIPPTTPLGRWLTPLAGLAKALHANEPNRSKDQAVKELVDENVKMQVDNICQSQTIIEAWKAGKKLHVHGWVFHLDTGKLRCLKISQGPAK